MVVAVVPINKPSWPSLRIITMILLFEVVCVTAIPQRERTYSPLSSALPAAFKVTLSSGLSRRSTPSSEFRVGIQTAPISYVNPYQQDYDDDEYDDDDDDDGGDDDTQEYATQDEP